MTSDHDRSLWAASSREQIAASALDTDLDVDLLIVGGGFTGCSAALEAARRGASVALLEAQRIGHGGSGRNVGLVNAGLWLPPNEVLGHLGHDAGKHLLDALSVGPDLVFDLIEREGIDCEATRGGTMHLAHSPGGKKNLQERFRQSNLLGRKLELLNAEQTALRTGSNAFHGALRDPGAGTIQPLDYCRGLARAAAGHGARLFEQMPADRIHRRGSIWEVHANGRKLRAERLLMATNAYHNGIEGPFTPRFVPVSFSQFATAPLAPEQLRSILPQAEGCWDTALVMSSFRIDRAGRLILGGIGNATGPAAPVHTSWARRKLRQVYPELAGTAFEYCWQGRIAMTGDHIPKIVQFGPDALSVFGYSGRGIGPGTIFGKQAAIALLEGRNSGLPLPVQKTYTENFSALRGGYVEFGATLTHALRPAPFG